MLGSALDQVILLHYAESIVAIDEKEIVRYRTPLKIKGKKRWCEVEEHDTATGIGNWPDRFFAQIVQGFIDAGHSQCSVVGNALSYLLDARALVEFALPVMLEVANS